MKKLLLSFLSVVAGGLSLHATTLHIGMELNYTGDVYVYRYGGTSADDWNSMGDGQKATLEGNKYGRRWYSIDMNGNTSAIVRFDNWSKRVDEVKDISGDDYYMYVSTTTTTQVDGTDTYASGKLSSEGWQTMKFSNDVDGKWDDNAETCVRVDDNTFTYTLTKEQIAQANKSQIYFRFKLGDGVFFVGDYYWNNHYYRLVSTESNANLAIAASTTSVTKSTNEEKNWVVQVPTYDYEKLVFTIQDTKSGTDFDNAWKVSVDAYIAKTVSAADKYATFGTSVPVDLSVLSGVTAYTATADASTKKVTLTEKKDALQGGEGVLLENNGDSDVTLSIPVAANATASSGNSLKAFTESGRLTQPAGGDKTYYILGKQDDSVGFYMVNKSEGNAMGANTAYLEVDGAPSSARSFIALWDNTTGIAAIEAQQNDGQAYNLAGQRVAQPAKGLYIVNGKKVIMK